MNALTEGKVLSHRALHGAADMPVDAITGIRLSTPGGNSDDTPEN